MSALSELTPRHQQLVIDLVRNAGVDVSDWKNFKGGKSKAAANPKYCYEWSFIRPGKVVVLNLWFKNFRIKNGRIIHRHNLRKRRVIRAQTRNAAIWKRRALKVDEAIQTAYQNKLPIRVIVCDGKQRHPSDPNAEASRVSKRHLDPIAWAVTDYDFNSGSYNLTRGAQPAKPIYHARDEEFEGFEGQEEKRFVAHRKREGRMRKWKIEETLRLNNGRLICEVLDCGFDFAKRYGNIGIGYAQVHHKKPLSYAPKKGRTVRLKDLAVVCANCHAMIHIGGECRPIEKLISQGKK